MIPEIEKTVSGIEKEIEQVFSDYVVLTSYDRNSFLTDTGLANNTLTNSLNGEHHPKFKVLLLMRMALFEGGEAQIFPQAPREVAKYLSLNELDARLVAAYLGHDGERMKQLADRLYELADEENPSLSSLVELMPKTPKVKKKKKDCDK
ncbi:MAG: hypothetical protein LUI85_05655 [Bacteroides sp.]|nr:hypothetical protein [Bacteroides sp.]